MYQKSSATLRLAAIMVVLPWLIIDEGNAVTLHNLKIVQQSKELSGGPWARVISEIQPLFSCRTRTLTRTHVSSDLQPQGAQGSQRNERAEGAPLTRRVLPPWVRLK